jgi:hypothetical protein
MGPAASDRTPRELQRRARMVAALQRAAGAHGRAAAHFEVAYRVHSEAAALFRDRVRFSDSSQEQERAATRLRLASIERKRAVSDWAAAQRVSRLGWRDAESVTGEDGVGQQVRRTTSTLPEEPEEKNNQVAGVVP